MIIRNHKPTPLKLSPEQIASLRGDASKEKPSLTTKAVNVAKAGGRVVKAATTGQPIFVSNEVRDQRIAICRACEYWNEGGNIGLGECTHSKCGCTKLKQGLATETCPMGKWNAS